MTTSSTVRPADAELLALHRLRDAIISLGLPYSAQVALVAATGSYAKAIADRILADRSEIQ